MGGILLYNGNYHRTDKPLFTGANRAFLYGDGLFETMRFSKNRLIFSNDHYARVSKGMQLLGMNRPSLFTSGFLQDASAALCKKNKLAHARLRLEVFRNDGGKFLPHTRQVSWLLTAEATGENTGVLNKNGLHVDIYPHYRKTCDLLSNIKTINCIPYILAALFAKKRRLGDCLILNTKGNIAETASANIFWVNKEQLHTPPLSEGCIEGVMRKNILRILQQHHTPAKEKILTPQTLLNADEVFLSNAMSIRWIKKFGRTTYRKNHSEKIAALISHSLA